MDRERLATAQARSAEVARAWNGSPATSALRCRFAGLAPDDVAGVAAQATDLFGDDSWVSSLLGPLIDALAGDPWIEPPLRISRDGVRTGAILFESPLVTITASVLSADALRALPPPRSVVVPGRLTIVRYVRGGGARLRLWHAGAAGDDGREAATARRCRPLGVLPLADGVVLRLDGRTRGWLIEQAESDVVMLSASVRIGAAAVMRDYALPGGDLLRSATLDDGAARTQMLLTLLRLSGRSNALEAFETATHDDAVFLRWAAMREWIALDARSALPRLADMARSDADRDVRSAAGATLAMIERRRAAARCPA